MTETNASVSRTGRPTIPRFLVISLVLLLVLLFILLRFPWDSLARRIEYEVSAASGGQISIENLAPAITARGPVLRARDVVIEHPAVDRLRLKELELAPRLSMAWLSGEPRLRIWADSDLGVVDGVLDLGESPSFEGRVQRIDLARLPLRTDASGIRLSGSLDATTDLTLRRNGTVLGRVAFESPSLVIESDTLPTAIPFSAAHGVIVILDDGATQIENVRLEGELVEGRVSGEIGLANRRQSPPIDLNAELHVVDPMLRRLAPNAGIPMAPNGDVAMRVRGTLAAPVMEPLPASASRRIRARNRSARERE